MTGGTGRVGSAIAARLERDGWSVKAAGRSGRRSRRGRPGQRSSSNARSRSSGGSTSSSTRPARASRRSRVESSTEADWDAAFGATAKGSFFVTQAAVPALRESRGCVVMVEDVAAYQPWPSFAAHCAAKAAQAMLTRVLARALAPEVRVCGVAPGPVAVEPGRRTARRGDAPGPRRLARRRGGRGRLPRRSGLRHGHHDGRGRRPVAAIRSGPRAVKTRAWRLRSTPPAALARGLAPSSTMKPVAANEASDAS